MYCNSKTNPLLLNFMLACTRYIPTPDHLSFLIEQCRRSNILPTDSPAITLISCSLFKISLARYLSLQIEESIETRSCIAHQQRHLSVLFNGYNEKKHERYRLPLLSQSARCIVNLSSALRRPISNDSRFKDLKK